ncbi:hypothetical protein PBCVNEJV1_839L [Paramecium bursaria Chlorella virus NE-JV-1]|nr:hypothetical protein PBCVNEJV1_839L [Paramecium bursaria Chlorella virus NE-JV-1]
MDTPEVLAILFFMLVCICLLKAFIIIDKARRAYVFGLPIAMNYAVMISYAVDRKSSQYKAPFNVINNQHRVYTYKDTSVISPNSDTPYSMMWLDLRNGPMVLSVPEIKDRYYSVQMIDSSTYNYGYIGTRTTGTEEGSYLIGYGPLSRMLPKGIKRVYHASSPLSLLIVKTQLLGPEDMPNVVKIQNKLKLQTLHEFDGSPNIVGTPLPPFKKYTNNDIKVKFLEVLDAALQYVPADKYSKGIYKLLGDMGIGPEKVDNYSENPGWYKWLANIGISWGEQDVSKAVKQIPKINGWGIVKIKAGIDDYAGNWLKRSLVAKVGIYANNYDEAFYPISYNDCSGRTLSGNNKYYIDIGLDNLPPVHAFWSITMYDAKTRLLVKNPIDRYLINSSMISSMKTKNKNVRLYIQKDSPGKDLETNWLPSPSDTFYLILRLYYPKEKATSGHWRPYVICN